MKIEPTKFECYECGKPCDLSHERYFVVPGYIMVPNRYLLCDEHQNLNFYFEDFYNLNPDGSVTRKMKPE